jgi:hypothetical protein
MADASFAASVRQQVESQSGSPGLAARMVPLAANESKFADLASRLEVFLLRPGGPASPFSTAQLSPMRLPDPRQMQEVVQDVIAQVESVLPRMRSLVHHPVVQRMVVDLTTQIMQRVAARSVKFVFAGGGLPPPR